MNQTKNGIVLVTVVLALAVFAVTAFKYPGFLLPKEETEAGSGTDFAAQNTEEGKQNKGTGKQIDYTATNETDKLSPEKLSAEFEESGVSVTLTEWVLDDGQEKELQVRSMKPLYDPDGEYVIKAYEVTLGDIHELDDFVEIRIPYDTSFCDEGEDPAECVGGLYYNEENSVWEEVLYTVDAAAGEIVIETDHFSRFGAITLKNKGRRDAMLCMAKEKITADYDIGYLDEDQAVKVMQQLCDTENEESETSKLAGNQVLQQAMALSGSLKNVSDGLGTAFSFAYFLDLSDVTMAGRYVELSVPGRPAQGYLTPIFFSNSSNVYNTDMINKASRNLSRVGNAVSACKLVYLVAKAGTQGAPDSEIWEIYKESASLAVNLAGGVTLGALLAPISLADTFINGMYEDAMAIKESQIEEMYMYFNTDYPGSDFRVTCRAGRSLKDWRKVIIKLIEENPEADSADLLREEIDDFADDFWSLNSDQISDVVAQMPKTIKRITVDDERIRRKITNGYKEELYQQLTPVLTSVRNYYNKKMVLKVQQQITAAVRFYNKTITFDIVEEDPEKEVKYGGCKCIFAPLYEDADVSNWSSTLPENGPGLTGEMTLIGHITSGSPDYLLVFDKDADMTQDDPVLSVPFTIDQENHIQIILKEPEDDGELVYCLDTTVYISHYDNREQAGSTREGHSYLPPASRVDLSPSGSSTEDNTANAAFNGADVAVVEDTGVSDVSLTDSKISVRYEDEYGEVTEYDIDYPGRIISNISEFDKFSLDRMMVYNVYTPDMPDCQIVIYSKGAFLNGGISSCVKTMNEGDIVCINFLDIALRYVCMSKKESEGKEVNHIESNGFDYAREGQWK